MKTKFTLFVCLLISSSTYLFSQNVAINTTGAVANTSALLDIDAAPGNNKGLLIPRVALTATNNNAPIGGAITTSLMVYNTATAGAGTATAVTPGFYYWDGVQWVRFTGNGWLVGTSTATTNPIGAAGSIGYLGTSTNSHVDLVTNNTVRGRISNLGEFFIGTTNTVLAGDLMNGVSNVTFPWAVNGYSAQNGAATYGQITGGATIFAGVQGEYNGTNAQGAGVRGLSVNATAGTSFAAPHTGVYGGATTAGTYKFGVVGSGGTTTRSGGVMGYDYGLGVGALGYFANNGLDYSVYGFGLGYATGIAGGMLPSEFYKLHPDLDPLSKPNNNIGLGIYGGVMGGWVKGLVYGTAFSGDRFATYTDGKSVTNNLMISLIDNNTDSRTIAYAPVSLTADISQKGRTSLNNGIATIALSEDIKNVIDINSLVINITPMGQSNGLYVEKISSEGIVIKENNNGTSTLDFCWTITATRTDLRSDVSAEVVNDNFDKKLNGIMFNENNNVDQPTSVWWDGKNVRFDPISEEDLILIRGQQILKHQENNNSMMRPNTTNNQ